MHFIIERLNREVVLLRYVIIGSVCAALDFGIFTLVISVGFSYQLSNLLGYISGTIVSFIINRKYNFKVKDDILKRFGLFMSVAFLGLSSSAIFLYLMIDVLEFNTLLSKLISLILVVAIQFTLNKKLTFG